MKKSNIYFLIALVCALVADTATYARIWWAAVVMYAVFAYCMVRLIIDNNRREEHIDDQYERTRKAVNRLYKVIEDNDLMTKQEIEKIRQDAEDKPRGVVRPGSRPSITYARMKLLEKGEIPYDGGREDPESA